MKTLKILSVSALLFAGCTAPVRVEYPAPATPDGFVLIDSYDAGRPKDYVKFHNASELESIKAKVMFHDPATQKWAPYGSVSLKETGDTDTLGDSKNFGGGLPKLRYFAVKFADGKAHRVRIDGAHNDLHVYVED